MNAQTRRSLATMLVGLAATLIGLLVATTVRRKACLDAGGRWLAERRCEAAAAPGDGRAYLLGALAGLFAAVALWRTYTFFAERAGRRR